MTRDQLKEDSTVKWSWDVTTPNGEHYGVNNLDYASAFDSWTNLKYETKDETLRGIMEEVEKGFGFYARYNAGYHVRTSAERPTTKSTETHWCPRRVEGEATVQGPDHWDTFPNGQRVCDYCGSLHPDDMLALLTEHGLSAIEPSTKGYKWYLAQGIAAQNASMGLSKYYRMHDTDALREKLKELTDQKSAL